MQIAPGLFSMGQEKGGHVHAFLLDDGEGLTLIDTLYDDDGSVVLAEIKQAGRQVTDLKNIILTHAHRSHLGGLAALRKMSNATVYSHEWEEGIIAGKRKAERVGLWPRKPLQVYKLQIGLALGLRPHVPCPVDRPLKDGDHIGPLEVVATPGHTPGCLSFYWRDRKALIVGDVVATWPEITAGWPGLTLDNEQNLRAVGSLSEATEAEILCVGHGEPLTTGCAAVLRRLREGNPG